MFDFLSSRFSSVFSRLTGQSVLTERNIHETLEKVKEALFEADVPYQVVIAFIDDIKQEVLGKKITTSLRPGEQFVKIMHDRLKALLSGGTVSRTTEIPDRGIVLIMGLQGSGKTTTIAKCAHLVKNKDSAKRILCASIDFYRPAAVEQLEILAEKVGIGFYRATTQDVLAAAQEIYTFFKKERYDLLFLDTAGRLHVDASMLDQLADVKKAVNPVCSVLVLDAMTGQESLHVAQQFDDAVGFDWAVLSKLDSDARGGSALAFCYVLKKQIAFIGTGEKIDDFEQFYPDRAAGRILGMGDIQSLLERAEQKIQKHEQEDVLRSFMKGQFTLADFAQQIDMMGRMGSFATLMQYIPGMPAVSLSQNQLEKGEQQMKRFRAIINSMTPKERLNEKILDGSRKGRIAKGAGVAVQDINFLLQKFEESKQFAKLFKKMGRFPGFN